jgi:hypothetical protein
MEPLLIFIGMKEMEEDVKGWRWVEPLFCEFLDPPLTISPSLGPCLVPKKFCRIFQILHHIESLDTVEMPSPSHPNFSTSFEAILCAIFCSSVYIACYPR